MHARISPSALSERMAAERKARIALLMDREDAHCAALRLRIPGQNLVGRDADGQPFLTKEPECLRMGISADRHVKIKYRREESGRVDETFSKGMRIPRKSATVSTDVFRGVRSLKHVREGYEREFSKRDEIMGEAERINAELAARGSGMGAGEIDLVENRLEAVLEGISSDLAAAKRLGRFRIEEIFEYLEPAKYLQGFWKEAMVGAACSKLVAFRNSYGEWRDGQVAQCMAYNRLRECSLRKIRDRELRRLVLEWAQFIDDYGYAAAKLWKRDMENAKRIGELISVMAGGNGNVLSRIADIGKGMDDRHVEGKAKGELRLAYRELKEGRAGKGVGHILRAVDILEGSKPWRVAEELGKTGDSYMALTVGRIEKAVELLVEKNHIARSPQLLREAAQKMGAF